MNSLLEINTESEKRKISEFIKSTLKRAGIQNVILAVSGGIDSATSLNVLSETGNLQNIFVVHLHYYEKSLELFHTVVDPLKIPKENVLLSPIKDQVDSIAGMLNLKNPQTSLEKIRLGNIMARVRMIMLFDYARKLNALVCGTENRSEYWLGYFTRFGDAASDFEPLHHLYKTQVRQLAEFLNVPDAILKATPSAGLWQGQTDEDELGFSYEQADPVLYLYFDKKQSISQIKKLGYSNADRIIKFALKNSFKHEVPYVL